MALDRSDGLADATLQILTRDSAVRRLREIARQVAGSDAERDRRPRWIDAAELVRRVRPFVSAN